MRITVVVNEKEGKEIKDFCRRNGIVQSVLGRNLFINAVRKGIIPIIDSSVDDVQDEDNNQHDDDAF
jgi:hypothetical protein